MYIKNIIFYKFILIIIAIVSIFFISSYSFSQSSLDINKIESHINKTMDSEKIYGLSIGIIKDDNVLYKSDFGNVKDRDTDKFFIGSISKTFTAFGILKLADDGKINIDDPVYKYIEWFKIGDGKESNKITVRHLLNHTSGLSDLGYKNKLPNNISIEDLVRDLVSKSKFTKNVGTVEQYFNEGYSILGLIIEYVSGKSYSEFIQENIFNPLNMNNSVVPSLDSDKIEIKGHRIFFGFPIEYTQEVSYSDVPSGYIISTLDDMLKFLIMLNNDGLFNGKRILSAEYMDLMKTPSDVGDYCMGLSLSKYNDISHIGHTGLLPSFYADLKMLPDGYGMVTLINQSNFLYMFFAYPKLDGVIDIIYGNEPADGGISLGLVLIILIILVVVTTLPKLISIIRIPFNTSKVTGKKKFSFWSGIAIEIIICLLLMFGIPMYLSIMSHRDFNWFFIFDYFIDVVLWVFVDIVISIIVVVEKIIIRLVSK